MFGRTVNSGKMMRIVVLLCSLCFTFAAPPGKEFVFVDSLVIANDALIDCRARGGDLVSIHNADENKAVQNLLAENGAPEAWLGFTDFFTEAVTINGCDATCDAQCLATYFWTDGSLNDFTNFAVGQPNNGCCQFIIFIGCVFDSQECTVMLQFDGTWNDLDCGELRPYVCLIDLPPDDNDPPTVPPDDIDPEIEINLDEKNNDVDYTVTIVVGVLIGITGLAFLGFAGRVAYRRYQNNDEKSSSSVNPKYNRYPESFEPEYGQQFTTTPSPNSNRYTLMSLGNVIANKYFRASSRFSRNSTTPSAAQQTATNTNLGTQNTNYFGNTNGEQFREEGTPVVSKFRL